MDAKGFIGLFITIVLTGFWGLWGNQRWYLYLMIAPCIIAYISEPFSKRKEKQYASLFFLALCVSIVLNLFFSYYNRGQNLLSALQDIEFLEYLLFFSYFLFAKLKLTINNIEKIIEISYVLFILCYLVEYFIFYPKDVFRLLAFTSDEHRFRMVGEIICFIGYFYVFNKLLKGNINKIYGSFLVFLGAFVVILLGFRTHVAALALATLWQIIKIKGLGLSILKAFTIVGLLTFLILRIGPVEKVVEKMQIRQSEQVYSNDDYIRVLQWDYYMNHFFISHTDYIFGAGIAFGNSNSKAQVDYNNGRKISTSVAQWRDWGLIGLSWIMGIPYVLLFLLFIFYMIFAKVPSQYAYISATYLELLLSGFTTTEFFRSGAFIFHGLLLLLMIRIVSLRNLSSRGKIKYKNYHSKVVTRINRPFVGS